MCSHPIDGYQLDPKYPLCHGNKDNEQCLLNFELDPEYINPSDGHQICSACFSALTPYEQGYYLRPTGRGTSVVNPVASVPSSGYVSPTVSGSGASEVNPAVLALAGPTARAVSVSPSNSKTKSLNRTKGVEQTNGGSGNADSPAAPTGKSREIPTKIIAQIENHFNDGVSMHDVTNAEGLASPWCGYKTVFVNSYVNCEKWLEKSSREIQEKHSKIQKVVLLLPVRSDAEWWHKYVLSKAMATRIAFVENGIKFKGFQQKSPPICFVVLENKTRANRVNLDSVDFYIEEKIALAQRKARNSLKSKGPQKKKKMIRFVPRREIPEGILNQINNQFNSTTKM